MHLNTEQLIPRSVVVKNIDTAFVFVPSAAEPAVLLLRARHELPWG
jgi:hypothetical protein